MMPPPAPSGRTLVRFCEDWLPGLDSSTRSAALVREQLNAYVSIEVASVPRAIRVCAPAASPPTSGVLLEAARGFGCDHVRDLRCTLHLETLHLRLQDPVRIGDPLVLPQMFEPTVDQKRLDEA